MSNLFLILSIMFNRTNNFRVTMGVFLFLLLAACNNNGENNVQIKFDKAKWNEKEDPAFPPANRSKMLKDLTSNHKLVGLKYYQLIDLLGLPNNVDSNTLTYTIIEDYGSDIDPVYTKSLKISFSKDSVISSFKIKEWKK